MTAFSTSIKVMGTRYLILIRQLTKTKIYLYVISIKILDSKEFMYFIKTETSIYIAVPYEALNILVNVRPLVSSTNQFVTFSSL